VASRRPSAHSRCALRRARGSPIAQYDPMAVDGVRRAPAKPATRTARNHTQRPAASERALQIDWHTLFERHDFFQRYAYPWGLGKRAALRPVARAL
jgi:hypothetical protein